MKFFEDRQKANAVGLVLALVAGFMWAFTDLTTLAMATTFVVAGYWAVYGIMGRGNSSEKSEE